MTGPDPALTARRRVRVTRVGEAVSDQIRELILNGELRDGDKLPRVEQLMHEFGVAASAVRAAVQILEAEGLVVVRRGSHGGAVVRRPDPTTAAYMTALVLRNRATDLRDVFETRVHIEALCAALCARRPDRDRTVLPRLRRLNVEARRVDLTHAAFVSSMSVFHETLVQSCGSDSLTLVAGVIETIANANTLAWAEQADGEDHAASHASRQRSLAYHEEICELIEAGEDVRAGEVMAEHSADMCLVERWFSGIDLSAPVDPSIIRSSR